MGQLNADGDGVFLWALEGPDQFVQLVQSDTPRRGVQVATELRKVTTRYPGAAKPSTQIMGTTEEDIPFEGTFRDDLYGLQGHAAAQDAALRALARSSRLCVLNWGQAIVKRGYVQRVESTWHAEGWIDYRFTFHVVESDEAEVLEVAYPATETPFDLLALLREISAAVQDAAEAAVLINNVVRAIT